MRGWMLITERSAQTIGPPDGGRIEDQVPTGAWVKRGRVGSFRSPVGQFPAGHDFQTGNRRRIAMPFPAYQARNAVAVFHSGAVEEPMFFIRANPIRAAGNRKGATCPNESGFVWPIVPQCCQFGKAILHGRLLNRAILADAANDTMRHPPSTG